MKSKNVKRLGEKLVALDLDRLHEVLDYDPETGAFTWRMQLSPRGLVGNPAGKTGKGGYRKISIDKVEYPAHHLAWFHFYGAPAEEELDFINHKVDDLRIVNLREATRAQNAQYRKRDARNTTGLKGAARFYNPGNRARYRSSIRVGDRRIFLGLFHTAEEAHAAYCEAAKKYFGKYGRTE